MPDLRRRKRITGGVLVAVAGVMTGLSFASVPLYQLFCKATGFGGTPRTAAAAPQGKPSDRTIRVRFDANVNSGLPWTFRPEQHEISVHLGESTLAYYLAANDSDRPAAGTATYNVTPHVAGPYVAKLDCFCFSEQRLAPHERVAMPVSFFVDPAIFDDPNTKDIQSITLSYTFFPAIKGAEEKTGPGQPKRPAGS